jgi:hypothetical protein
MNTQETIFWLERGMDVKHRRRNLTSEWITSPDPTWPDPNYEDDRCLLRTIRLSDVDRCLSHFVDHGIPVQTIRETHMQVQHLPLRTAFLTMMDVLDGIEDRILNLKGKP